MLSTPATTTMTMNVATHTRTRVCPFELMHNLSWDNICAKILSKIHSFTGFNSLCETKTIIDDERMTMLMDATTIKMFIFRSNGRMCIKVIIVIVVAHRDQQHLGCVCVSLQILILPNSNDIKLEHIWTNANPTLWQLDWDRDTDFGTFFPFLIELTHICNTMRSSQRLSSLALERNELCFIVLTEF